MSLYNNELDGALKVYHQIAEGSEGRGEVWARFANAGVSERSHV